MFTRSTHRNRALCCAIPKLRTIKVGGSRWASAQSIKSVGSSKLIELYAPSLVLSLYMNIRQVILGSFQFFALYKVRSLMIHQYDDNGWMANVRLCGYVLRRLFWSSEIECDFYAYDLYIKWKNTVKKNNKSARRAAIHTCGTYKIQCFGIAKCMFGFLVNLW